MKAQRVSGERPVGEGERDMICSEIMRRKVARCIRLVSVILFSSFFLAVPSFAQLSDKAVGHSGVAADPLPISVFAALPFVENISLSPDGSHMAGLFALAGKQNIVIAPVFGEVSKVISFGVPDLNEVAWVRWVGNDNIIVGLYALRGVEGSNWYISRMIAVNRKARKVTRIMWDAGGQNASDVLWVAQDGNPQILVSAQDSIYTNYPGFWPSVYRVNVETGGKTEIQRGRTNILNWSADQKGIVRIGLGYNQSNARENLIYRSAGSGAMRTVERVNPFEDEELTIPFHFVPDSDLGYVFLKEDDGRRSIAEMDLTTGTVTQAIYKLKDVRSVIISTNGAKLLGAGVGKGGEEVHWFDAEMAAHQKTLEAASPQSDVRILSLSDDQSRMLVNFSTADNPGLLYYFDAKSGGLHRIGAMNERLGGQRLSRSRYVQYKARDGLEIEGVLTMPRGQSSTNLPFIVMPHGGPWAHDTLGYDYIVQMLAERGYAVLQPNFRGSTGYGVAFEHAGRGEMGLAMQDDVTDGVAWAIAQGIADPKRVCIMGSSYGGYSAMWGIAKDPDLYRCAVSISGVSNVRREVNDFGGAIRSRLYRSHWERMSENFDAISPINAVGRIKAPLLLVHGKKDVTVDHSQSVRMVAAMVRAGKTAELVSIPLADHHFTREADRLTMLTAIEKFLKKYNPAN